tara:strand:- start:1937 stop:3406 length:1470 start_codon:yes stop_codon:yes gene_type:complete
MNMDNMQLIMENWRKYSEKQVNLLEIEKSPVYLFDKSLNENLLQEAKPTKQITYEKFFENVNKGLITEDKAVDMWIDSILYERQLLINEGLLDYLSVKWQAAAKKGKEAFNKLIQLKVKAFDQLHTLSIKMQLGILKILGKGMSLVKSSIMMPIKVAQKVLKGTSKLVGVKDPSHKSVILATGGAVIVATITAAAYMTLASASGPIAEMLELHQAGVSGVSIAGLCESKGLKKSEAILIESLCTELANAEPVKIIQACVKELGTEQAFNGAASQLKEIASGAEAWDMFEMETYVSEYLDTAIDFESLNISKTTTFTQLENGITQTQRLAIRSAETLASNMGDILQQEAVGSTEQFGKVLKGTLADGGEVLAKAMQLHAAITEQDPLLARSMEMVGSNLEVLADGFVESSMEINSTVETIYQTGGTEEIKISSESHQVIETITKKYFHEGSAQGAFPVDAEPPTRIPTATADIPTTRGQSQTFTKHIEKV